MLYTIELLPNGIERIGISRFYVAQDYNSWLNTVKEEIHHFYREDKRVDTERVLKSIYDLVEQDKPKTSQIELFGARFTCLVTEKWTEEEFKAFVCRQTEDVFLRHERNLLDDMSVFFHWLKHNDFKLKTYQRLLDAFHQADYSVFEKESRAALKKAIEEMILEMDLLMKKGRNRDEKWLNELEATTKKFESKSNVKQWVVSDEMESFQNHRLYLEKKYLFMVLETKFPVLS